MAHDRWIVSVLLGIVLGGCAQTPSNVVAPTSEKPDPAVPKLQQQVAALEARIERLEHGAAESSKRATTSSPGWSCMAKCGTRSTQTTDFHVDYTRVTGHGATAAEAYEDMRGRCKGTIYERVENERYLGGEMKNVCITETGVAPH